MRTGHPPVALFDYDLPEDLIALSPAERREDAGMFVHDRALKTETHATVGGIARWLRAGDLLVFNGARVDPVRVVWETPKGKKEELLLLKLLSDEPRASRWEAVVSGKKLPLETFFTLSGGKHFRLEKRDGTFAVVTLDACEKEVRDWLRQYGLPPLPPYIRKERVRRGRAETSPDDPERYQTVFAERSGAVAAPTAGLHFSEKLLDEIRAAGVESARVHLAVGWGTFQPLTEAHWRSGRLHPEWAEISSETAGQLLKALREGRRVVAVGTTAVRALEWWHREGRPADGISGWCDLFLRPPWSPGVTGALLTNFHLPRSSLLALVAGFLGDNGEETIVKLYREAVARRYRFYSYGDCMLIL